MNPPFVSSSKYSGSVGDTNGFVFNETLKITFSYPDYSFDNFHSSPYQSFSLKSNIPVLLIRPNVFAKSINTVT